MKHKIQFTPEAWEDLQFWLAQPRMMRRVIKLLADIERDPTGKGIGKTELLRGHLAGWSSRRIDDEHRLIYRVENDIIEILMCRGHYDD